MKTIIIIILTTFNLGINAQSDTTWIDILVEPDLLVYFPGTPKTNFTSLINSYEYKNGHLIFRVTSEKSPIIYYGRTIKEVDEEYYSTLTNKTITSKQKLIKENNFKFEGHNIRELIYLDTINYRPCMVTLQILNVIGFEEAMYKFYLIDFENRTAIPEIYNSFFKNWNLYYKLENDIDKDRSKGNNVLKDKGLIIEDEGRKKKRHK